MSKLKFRTLMYGFFACITTPFVHAASNVIDVMVVYTPTVAQAYSGNPTTRINQLLAVTNQIYADSGVDLELHLVHAVQISYTDDNAASTALNDITNGSGAFAVIPALRDQYKADMVILYRPFKQVQAACGVAWLGGNKNNGVFTAGHKALMYSSLAIATCPDFVTAHELGHNMGLAHSRRQDGTGGTFPYALGYGVDGLFTTVMAYETSFNDPYGQKKILKFASPSLTCTGVPCGINRADANNGADAVYTLGVTAPQIAEFYPGSVTSAGSSGNANNSSGNSELNILAAAITTAQTAADAAAAALAANTTAIATKTATANSAKTALTQATTTLKVAKASYTTAVKASATAAAKVTKASATVNSAQTKYNSAKVGAAKDAALANLNTAIATYNAAVITANNAAAAVTPLQTAMTSATSALATATTIYNTAANALKTEKALTASLKAAVTSTKKAYTAAVAAYNKVAKKLGVALR